MKIRIITDDYRQNFKKIMHILINNSQEIMCIISNIKNPQLKREMKNFCEYFSNGHDIYTSLQFSLESKILQVLSSVMLLKETINYVEKIYMLKKKYFNICYYPYGLFIAIIFVFYFGFEIFKFSKIYILFFIICFFTTNLIIYMLINYFINKTYYKIIELQKHVLFLRKQINMININENIINEIITIGIDNIEAKFSTTIEHSWDFIFQLLNISSFILVIENIIFIGVFLWIIMSKFLESIL